MAEPNANKSRTVFGRWFDIIVIMFMIAHIPTTILIDSQSVIPRDIFPQFARDVLDWHIETNRDTLVSVNPPWLVGMIMFEVIFQLPFFFLCTYAFIRQRKWIRIPALVYGVHTATTLIPILSHILSEENLILGGIYMPYFIVPGLLATKMCMMEDPFPYRSKVKKGKAKRS